MQMKQEKPKAKPSDRQIEINSKLVKMISLGDELLADELPNKSDMDKVQKRKDDHCNLCSKSFGILKNQRHNCYSCGASVCQKCSENKI
jgi:hypothetical protein